MENNINENNSNNDNGKTNFSELYKTKNVGKDFFDSYFKYDDAKVKLFNVSQFISTVVRNLKVDEAIEIEFFTKYIDAFDNDDIYEAIKNSKFTKKHFEALLNYYEFKHNKDVFMSELSRYVYGISEEKYVDMIEVLYKDLQYTTLRSIFESYAYQFKCILGNESLDKVIAFIESKKYIKPKDEESIKLFNYILSDPNYAYKNYRNYLSLNQTILSSESFAYYKENKITINLNTIINSCESLKDKVTNFERFARYDGNQIKSVSQDNVTKYIKEVIENKTHINIEKDIADDMSIKNIVEAIYAKCVSNKDMIMEKYKLYSFKQEIIRDIACKLNPFICGKVRGKFKIGLKEFKILAALSGRNICCDNRTSCRTITFDDIYCGFKLDKSIFEELINNEEFFKEIFSVDEINVDKDVDNIKNDPILGDINMKWSNAISYDGIENERVLAYKFFIAKRFIVSNNIPKNLIDDFHKKFKDMVGEKDKEEITYEFIRTQSVPENFKENIEDNARLLRALAVSGKCSKREKAFAKLCSDSNESII